MRANRTFDWGFDRAHQDAVLRTAILERSEAWRCDCKSAKKSANLPGPALWNSNPPEVCEIVAPIAPVLELLDEDSLQFRAELYKLAATGNLRRSTDLIFSHFDGLLRAARLTECDRLLASIDVTQLPAALLRSLLTITVPVKAQLPNRPQVVDRIRDAMSREVGDERTSRVLRHVI